MKVDTWYTSINTIVMFEQKTSNGALKSDGDV